MKGGMQPDLQQLLALARELSPVGRERLIRALSALPARPDLPLFQGGPPPQSAAWVRAERGHAVLATDAGEIEEGIPAGAAAIAGLWSSGAAEQERGGGAGEVGSVSGYAGPAL